MSYPIVTGALAALLLNPGHTPENSVSSALEMQGIVTPCADVTLLSNYPKEVVLELGKAGDPYRFRVFEHPDTRFLLLGNDLKFRPDASPEEQGDLFNRVLAIAEANNHTARFAINRLVLIIRCCHLWLQLAPRKPPTGVYRAGGGRENRSGPARQAVGISTCTDCANAKSRERNLSRLLAFSLKYHLSRLLCE